MMQFYSDEREGYKHLVDQLHQIDHCERTNVLTGQE